MFFEANRACQILAARNPTLITEVRGGLRSTQPNNPDGQLIFTPTYYTVRCTIKKDSVFSFLKMVKHSVGAHFPPRSHRSSSPAGNSRGTPRVWFTLSRIWSGANLPIIIGKKSRTGTPSEQPDPSSLKLQPYLDIIGSAGIASTKGEQGERCCSESQKHTRYPRGSSH